MLWESHSRRTCVTVSTLDTRGEEGTSASSAATEGFSLVLEHQHAKVWGFTQLIPNQGQTSVVAGIFVTSPSVGRRQLFFGQGSRHQTGRRMEVTSLWSAGISQFMAND